MEMELIARILFFSDPHLSVDSEKSEEKWFPPVCDLLEKIKFSWVVKKFLKFWDIVTQRAFSRMILKIKGLGKYDLTIGLGDYTPGANEKGMLTEKTQFQYYAFRKIIDKINSPKKLVWGDHDAGYRFNVSKKTGVKIGTEKGGMSVESTHMATKLIGPPFGCFSVGRANFVFISTNLIRNVDRSSDEKLQEMKIEQESFLAKALHNNAGNIFLLLHDPTALMEETAVRKIIDSHHEKIAAIIHGHLHAEFFRFFTRIFSKTYRRLCRQYKTILVPASWGMMGIGGGFLAMYIYSNRKYEIKKYSV